MPSLHSPDPLVTHTPPVLASRGAAVRPTPPRPGIMEQLSRARGRSRRVSVPQRELTHATSQLSIMIRTGVDVSSALYSLARQTGSPALRKILEQIRERVLEGESLSAAMAEHDSVFGGMYVASIAAGEISGRLPEVLKQLATLQRNALRLQKSVRTLLAYPALLVLISGAVIAALVIFVLPRFAQIFSEYETPLPVITRMLLTISGELRSRFWLWIPLAIGGFLGLTTLRSTERGRKFLDRVLLKTVFLRDVVQSLTVGRVCLLLGTMLENGVPLVDSLRLARQSLQNSLYRELFLKLEESVVNGRGMASTLTQSPLIPPAAGEMMRTGEQTGSLGQVAKLVGEHFEEEGESQLRELVTVLEPVITLFMGLVVAIVVLSVMLPLFDLGSLAKH